MATITTIDSGDQISNSRTDINNNFANLNSDKIETSVLDTDTAMAANSDAKIPSQKAVKAYIDTSGGQNASTTVRGIVEEATQAEVNAGTATGATGARLFVNPGAIPEPIYEEFLSSGTWTKPGRGVRVFVQVWGGGGSGGRHNDTNGASGGGGGAYAEGWFDIDDLGATETVTIGDGGAVAASATSNGNAGGNTTFGSWLTGIGGDAGLQTAGGNGGSMLSGFTVDTSFGGGAGGAGQASPVAGGASIFGGGGGGGGDTDSAGTGAAGGKSFYGGGGGGGRRGQTTGTGGAGGTSVFGGAGGTGQTESTAATAGSVPGGGGGGTEDSGGAGGKGKCIVTVF